jgi:hypothetical protein
MVAGFGLEQIECRFSKEGMSSSYYRYSYRPNPYLVLIFSFARVIAGRVLRIKVILTKNTQKFIRVVIRLLILGPTYFHSVL